MEEIQIFSSSTFGDIRTSGTSEQPLFCLVDLCRALGIKNNRNVAKRLETEDVRISDTLTEGGLQSMAYVTESGLYTVLLRAHNSEKAREFRKWVTSEVLPSIRRTGGYMIARQDESDEELLARAIMVANETIKRKNARIKVLEDENVEQHKQLIAIKSENEQLKARQTYMDVVLACKSTVIVTSIAQDYGMTAKSFNVLLRNYGIQHKVGGQWILYGKHLDKGYVNARPVEITHKNGTKSIKYNTEWTQKGRFFIYDTLKQHGVLPLIEKA